jgi:predicted Zn-dependent protease
MVPNWIRTGALGLGLTLSCLGCMSGKGYRATLSLGPEGAGAPIQELPPKDSAYVCAMTAQEFEKLGRVPEAIALYEKALMLQPGLEKKLARRMGILYDQAGEFTKADEQFARALEQNPKDADLFNDIGYSHYARGDWTGAEEHLTQAVELNPQHKRAWINLGMAIAQQNRYSESMRAFRKGTTEAEALCNLGFVMATQGNKEQSLEAYKRASELSPGLRLAQAAVNRYNSPELPRSEVKTENTKATQSTKAPPSPYHPVRSKASPYGGAISAEPIAPPPPAKIKVPEEYTQPIIIDPDLDSLPSRPKISEP